jgi:transcriptional antiterminator RfaH
MALQWYALRSKPRKEDVVWRLVSTRGFEVFYPRLRIKPVNPRARKVQPYFPGYMFIRVDLEKSGISSFQWMEHTAGLVSFGGEPAIVPDSLIHAIQNRVQEVETTTVNLIDNLRSGDIVRIHYGPFQGYEAIFNTRISGTERVRVLLKILGDRLLPIEMDAEAVNRIE